MRVRPGIWRGAAFALTALIVAGTGDAARANLPAREPRVPERHGVRPLASSAGGRLPDSPDRPHDPAPLALEVRNRNTSARATIRLYAEDGEVDRDALVSFMHVASSAASAADETLDLRLVQLAFRAACHFHAKSLVVVSATRRGAHGKHGSGDALDFQLDGVAAATLAAHARSYPRAGVGVYTHPKTQYVHLDVREQSYHWLDASPPGVTWRERRLADPGRDRRDASYVPSMDRPEPGLDVRAH